MFVHVCTAISIVDWRRNGVYRFRRPAGRETQHAVAFDGAIANRYRIEQNLLRPAAANTVPVKSVDLLRVWRGEQLW